HQNRGWPSESRGDDLSLQGRRRAAADARHLRIPGLVRRDREPRRLSRSAGPRRPGNAGTRADGHREHPAAIGRRQAGSAPRGREVVRMLWLTHALDILSRSERCVLVTVAQAKGSAPRETGAKMVVWETGTAGSVGGGHLEFRAIAFAHRMLAAGNGRGALFQSFSLGPDLNQGCGGRVSLLFEALDQSARTWLRQWAKVAAGHEPCAVVVHCRGNTTTRMFVPAEELDLLDLPEFLQRPIQSLLN